MRVWIAKVTETVSLGFAIVYIQAREGFFTMPMLNNLPLGRVMHALTCITLIETVAWHSRRLSSVAVAVLLVLSRGYAMQRGRRSVANVALRRAPCFDTRGFALQHLRTKLLPDPVVDTCASGFCLSVAAAGVSLSTCQLEPPLSLYSLRASRHPPTH